MRAVREPQARTSALQAAFEPPFLMASRLAGWRRVVEAVEALLTRVACLESAIEGATGEGVPADLVSRECVRACFLYGVQAGEFRWAVFFLRSAIVQPSRGHPLFPQCASEQSSRPSHVHGIGRVRRTHMNQTDGHVSLVALVPAERLSRLANLQRQTGVNVMHSLTAVFARIAAACANLASAVRDFTDLAKVRYRTAGRHQSHPVHSSDHDRQGMHHKTYIFFS